MSEGQGYGMAIAAAIGDRQTFDQLWSFVRHYLSQHEKKFCGGLMGWMWDGSSSCRPLDRPCDPDTDGCGGNQDSAFDGDVDIGIGLVFAAQQWPEYRDAAVDWVLKMECEINTAYDGEWYYATPGDTWDKSCDDYPRRACYYRAGYDGTVNLSYYPPGYFRVFGEFLVAHMPGSAQEKDQHRRFWYHTAATVYEIYERCYDEPSVDPALVTDWGTYSSPCSTGGDNYNWARALFRVSVDAAWFGHRTDVPENAPGSSRHYPGKSRVQAKIENIQRFFAAFHEDNPPEPKANRFSTICQNLTRRPAARAVVTRRSVTTPTSSTRRSLPSYRSSTTEARPRPSCGARRSRSPCRRWSSTTATIRSRSGSTPCSFLVGTSRTR